MPTLLLCVFLLEDQFLQVLSHNHGQLTNVGDNFNGVFDKNILDKNPDSGSF